MCPSLSKMLRVDKFLLVAVRRSLHFGCRGVCAIPHPQKAYRGGEDAFFAHGKGIGVADGVGGYASHGIDPALYTRNVMRFALQAVSASKRSCGETALDVLTTSWIEARQSGQPGGCPASLVTVVEGSYASVLNLGDCGIVTVRNGELLYRSEMQQHSFNCPFQLPEDPPSSGEQAKLELHEGDIFLCATDGVLDNVEVSDLLKHLCEVDQYGCTGVAERIGYLASTNAQNKKFLSPFAKHAIEAGYRYMGGKLDDITALVAKVTSVEEEQEVCPALITDYFQIK